MLRRIRLLSRRGLARRSLLLGGARGLLPRGRLPRRRRFRLDAAQRGLEVVEDEPDRRIAARRGQDGRGTVPDDEDTSLSRGHLELVTLGRHCIRGRRARGASRRL